MAESKTDYLPIRLNTLRPDAPVNFDVFIEVGDRKIHYIRDSDPIDRERLQKLKTKGVRKLFIDEKSEDQYLAYLDAGLNTLKDNSASVEARGSMAHDSMVTAAENAERNLETEQGMKRTEAHFGKVTDFLISNPKGIQSILDAAGCALDNHQHAATVASLAISLATRAGLTDPGDLLQLGIAALVHDLGKNKSGLDPMKPRDSLTPQERQIYERHPQEAVAMLSGKPHITPRILGLIADHEEIGRGRGFPEKKHYSKLAKPYQVLNLVNDFDRFCYEQKILHAKAIDPFFEKRGEYFTEELITVLATILN